MEKGNTRNSSDCKGNKQDAGIKYPRLPRHKEGSSPHPESRRKPNPQKNREVFDKRPRTRTGAFPQRFRSQVAECVDYDVLSKQGCKKGNGNYLLNFTSPPVEGRDYGGRRGTPMYNRNKLPKYNKELFLQANCQFIVRDDGNYAVYYENADALVEWSLIQEVRLTSHEVPSCPICLYPPIAAKITRCGHIYCWPCILHYLSLTDNGWQKCPICFEVVHKIDLKSVLPTTQRPVSVGDEITLCLMKRERGSLFPSPLTLQKSLLSACRVDDDETLTCFQKLLMASNTYVSNIIKREQRELCELLSEEKDAPEACFIESALELLYERECQLLKSHAQQVSVEEQEKPHNNYLVDGAPPEKLSNNNTEKEKLDLCTSHSNPPPETAGDIAKIDTETKLCAVENIENNPPLSALQESKSAESIVYGQNKKQKDYIFYQAEDGQHIYLHNINVRMLVKEFGSLEDSPQIIKAKVVELEKTSMTEVLRKRLRYLLHLPLTCEFQVAELNLSSLLSKSTIEEFAGEVLRRKNQRSRKAHNERKREKYIELEENRKLGKYPGATYNLNSVDQFPHYDPIQDHRQLSDQSPEEYEKQYPRASSSSLSTENSPELSNSTGTSFAQKVRDGRSSFAECHPADDRQIREGAHASSDYGAPASTKTFLNDFFQVQALDTAIKEREKLPVGKRETSKKKKGKQQLLLFTNSMCRNK